MSKLPWHLHHGRLRPLRPTPLDRPIILLALFSAVSAFGPAFHLWLPDSLPSPAFHRPSHSRVGSLGILPPFVFLAESSLGFPRRSQRLITRLQSFPNAALGLGLVHRRIILLSASFTGVRPPTSHFTHRTPRSVRRRASKYIPGKHFLPPHLQLKESSCRSTAETSSSFRP